MKTPFVSVIVPAHNYGQFIGQTLKSIFSQEFSDFELIIVNDCSTDNTDEVIQKYAHDPRMVYLKNDKNIGPYLTMARAASVAKGLYLAAIASDDYYLPGAFLKLFIEVQKHPNVPVVYGKYYLVDKDSNISNYLVHPGWHPDVRAARTSDLADLLRYDCYIGVTAAFMKNGLWNQYPFDYSLRFMSDYDHWLQLAQAKRPILFLDEYVAAVRHHGEQLSVGSSAVKNGSQLSDYLAILARYLVPKNYPRLAGYQADFLQQLESRISALQQYPEAAKVLEENKNKINTVMGQLTILDTLSRKKAISGPTVSVIVPTCNRPHMLPGALDSICAQTFQDIEIIVVNDGSKNIESLLLPYRERVSITYVHHGENRGPAGARNSGLKAARGEYICYLDDDDIFYPDHIASLLTCIEEQQLDGAYSDSYEAIQKEIDGVRITVGHKLLYSCDMDLSIILVNNILPTLCMMHKRACVEKVGYFDESLKTHEDWDLWIRLACSFRIKHLSKVTSEFRRVDTGNNITTDNLADFSRTREVIYKRYMHLASLEIKAQQEHALKLQRAMGNAKIPVETFMDTIVELVESSKLSEALIYYDEHRHAYGNLPELDRFDVLVEQIRKKQTQ